MEPLLENDKLEIVCCNNVNIRSCCISLDYIPYVILRIWQTSFRLVADSLPPSISLNRFLTTGFEPKPGWFFPTAGMNITVYTILSKQLVRFIKSFSALRCFSRLYSASNLVSEGKTVRYGRPQCHTKTSFPDLVSQQVFGSLFSKIYWILLLLTWKCVLLHY